MTKQKNSRIPSRRARAFGWAAACLLFSVLGPLSSAATSASVAEIKSTRVADLVLLDAGFNAGLRQGMVCRVTRGTTEIAEVLLVELRPNCAAALILSVEPKQSIRAGDSAAIKILKV